MASSLFPSSANPSPGGFFGSLRRRLLAVFGAALLTVVVASVLGVWYLVNRTEHEGWRNRQNEAARRAAETVGAFIDRQRQLLLLLDIFGRSQPAAERSGELEDLLARNPAFLELVYLDAEGRVLSYAPKVGPVLANLFSISQSAWFEKAKQGETHIGDVQLSAGDDACLILALPAAKGNVIAARLKMQVLQEVLFGLRFGESGISYLVNRNGRIIAHCDPAAAMARTRLEHHPELRSLVQTAKETWAGEYTDLHGRPVVGTTVPVPGTPWVVVAEVLQTEAYAASRTAWWVLLTGVLGIGAVIVLSVSVLLSRELLRPMRHLEIGVQQIAKGDLHHRIGLDSRNEIGRVAVAFDEMAARLQDREHQVAAQTAALQQSEARYRAIVEDQTELICRYLPDGTITFVNEAYGRYFGKRREELIGHSFMPLIPEEDRSLMQESMARLNERTPVSSVEHRVIMADGEIRWQSWSDRVIFDDEGRLIEFAGVGRDITDRKLAEEALLEAKSTLEQRVQKRTRELEEEVKAKERALTELASAQSSLLQASRAAGMAEVATGVLHNVGNVLNSVNVSCTLLMDQLRNSRIGNISRVAGLLAAPDGGLAHFLTNDPRGRQIPAYLTSLATALAKEHEAIFSEAKSLNGRIAHIKEIVSMQQSYGRVSGVNESILPEKLMEDALKLNAGSLARHGISVQRRYDPVGPIVIDKHKVLQILLNLINNAKYACAEKTGGEHHIRLAISSPAPDRVRMEVTDNGIGILRENMTRIFQHGFTTRKSGHGFGLHSGALAATGLGGSLSAHSDGPGHGATFILELPCHPGGGNETQ